MAVDPMGVLYGDGDKVSVMTTDFGAEVGIGKGVDTGSVGVTDPLHPISARIVSVPRRSEAP